MKLSVPIPVGFLAACKNIPVGGLATLCESVCVNQCVCGCVHGMMCIWIASILSRLYSRHSPSIYRIISGITVTMTTLKSLLKVNEYRNISLQPVSSWLECNIKERSKNLCKVIYMLLIQCSQNRLKKYSCIYCIKNE